MLLQKIGRSIIDKHASRCFWKKLDGRVNKEFEVYAKELVVKTKKLFSHHFLVSGKYLKYENCAWVFCSLQSSVGL